MELPIWTWQYIATNQKCCLRATATLRRERIHQIVGEAIESLHLVTGSALGVR